jgi:reactive chlorine resistance protein C
VVILIWIGLMKFTAYEAHGIRLYVANSPLMRWAYDVMSVRGFTGLLGGLMFLTTLSLLVTTPGVWEPSAAGFPGPVGKPGQVLIKDLALLGISLWSLGESWKASAGRRRPRELSH